MKKRLLNVETELVRLLGGETGLAEMMETFPSVEEYWAVLRSGEDFFYWESPLGVSRQEAVRMARQAAAEMAPEPGREILAAFLRITAELEWDLESLEKVANSVQESFGPENQDVDVIFMCDFSDKGTHFVLITAERNIEEREHRP